MKSILYSCWKSTKAVDLNHNFLFGCVLLVLKTEFFVTSIWVHPHFYFPAILGQRNGLECLTSQGCIHIWKNPFWSTLYSLMINWTILMRMEDESCQSQEMKQWVLILLNYNVRTKFSPFIKICPIWSEDTSRWRPSLLPKELKYKGLPESLWNQTSVSWPTDLWRKRFLILSVTVTRQCLYIQKYVKRESLGKINNGKLT